MLIHQVWSVVIDWRWENLPSEWVLLSIISADFLKFKVIKEITTSLFRVDCILICCTVAAVITPLTAVIVSLGMPIIHNARILLYQLSYFFPSNIVCGLVWVFAFSQLFISWLFLQKQSIILRRHCTYSCFCVSGPSADKSGLVHLYYII